MGVDVCRTHIKHDIRLLFQCTFLIRMQIADSSRARPIRINGFECFCLLDKCHITHWLNVNRDVYKINSATDVKYILHKYSADAIHFETHQYRCECLIKEEFFLFDSIGYVSIANSRSNERMKLIKLKNALKLATHYCIPHAKANHSQWSNKY